MLIHSSIETDTKPLALSFVEGHEIPHLENLSHQRKEGQPRIPQNLCISTKNYANFHHFGLGSSIFPGVVCERYPATRISCHSYSSKYQKVSKFKSFFLIFIDFNQLSVQCPKRKVQSRISSILCTQVTKSQN